MFFKTFLKCKNKHALIRKTNIKKILIWIKERNKKKSNFFKTFLKHKNKHALIRNSTQP